MAYAHVPQRVPRLVPRSLADQLRARQGRSGGGHLRQTLTGRQANLTRQQRAPLQ